MVYRHKSPSGHMEVPNDENHRLSISLMAMKRVLMRLPMASGELEVVRFKVVCAEDQPEQ